MPNTTVLSADGHTGVNGPVSVTTSLIRVRPGGSLVLEGSGWLPGSTVRIRLFSTPVLLGTATVDVNGNFSTAVSVPDDVPPGLHRLVISGLDEDNLPRRVAIPVRVLASEAPSPVVQSGATGSVNASGPALLPSTGAGLLHLGAQALAAFAIGGMLLVHARVSRGEGLAGVVRTAGRRADRPRSRSVR